MNSRIQRISLVVFTLLFSLNYGWNQCAMCKATVESGTDGGATIGETDYGNYINIGILFLMIIPYIILFFAFRKKIFKLFRDIRQAKG
ncbi:MAG: hypothetical protein R2799_00700 [Crocinitomicaceae bacterium]